MAYNPATSALFLAALLLFTAAVAAAPLNGLTVGGRLCCTANGNCPSGAQLRRSRRGGSVELHPSRPDRHHRRRHHRRHRSIQHHYPWSTWAHSWGAPTSMRRRRPASAASRRLPFAFHRHRRSSRHPPHRRAGIGSERHRGWICSSRGVIVISRGWSSVIMDVVLAKLRSCVD